MAIKPPATVVQCPKCNAKGIYAPSRDLITVLPRCAKCHFEMKYFRVANLFDFILYGRNRVGL